MDQNYGKSERVVRSAGCGMFQIWIALIFHVLAKQPTLFAMVFMAFGNYNPGWKCLDPSDLSTMNYTSENAPLSQISNETTRSSAYSIGSCNVFDKCHNVEFNPKISTIVTEWRLTCDRYWITSLIISVQMTGVLLGGIISGHLADLFGRKKVFYPTVALLGLLCIISIFSSNWQMFIAFRFFIGLMIASLVSLNSTLVSEFLNPLWRSRVLLIPAWPCGVMLFGIAAMICEDWRTMHIITAVLCGVLILTGLWVPESIRWLETQNKHEEFEKVRQKMLKTNKLTTETTIKDKENLETGLNTNEPKNNKEVLAVKRYTVFDLFRKGYKEYSIIIGFQNVSFSLLYYAIIFGAKNLHGNLYINIIILNGSTIPLCILPIFTANLVGRRKTSIMLLSFTAVCLLITSPIEVWASDDAKKYGTLVFTVLALATLGYAWSLNRVMTAEIYPTVVRAAAFGYGNLMSRFGGIIAPFLVPRSGESVYIAYLVMGIIGLMCTFSSLRLPETKGKNMKETFEDV